MKKILIKLSKGQNRFNCRYNGDDNKCEILIIDIEKSMAFVRFEKRVKKIERREVDSKFLFGNMDDDIPMEDVEVYSSEEWIYISNL